jgi:hypothetical protein
MRPLRNLIKISPGPLFFKEGEQKTGFLSNAEVEEFFSLFPIFILFPLGQREAVKKFEKCRAIAI